MRKTLFSANAITLLRISGTAVLLFLRPFSPAFFVVYTLTGVTDVLDGFVARKTGTASDFGAKLDSAAVSALLRSHASENFSGFVAHPAQKNLVGGGSGAVPACLLLYDCGHSLPSVCFPAYLSEQAHRCLYFLRTLFSVCVFRSGILFRGVRGRPSGRN